METPHNRSQHWSCVEPLSLPIAVATAAASPVFFLLLLPSVWALVFSWPRWGLETPWLPWGMSMWQVLRAWLLLTVLLCPGLSLLLLHMSHWTLFSKHKFKDKIVNNFKLVTTKHKPSMGTFWEWGSVQLQGPHLEVRPGARSHLWHK